jgi:multidrug resistance efflux pump
MNVKVLFLIFFVLFSLSAGEYYSKAEPKEFFSIKSQVNGEVVVVNEKLEGLDSDGNVVIKVDDKIDIADLEASNKKLKSLIKNIQLTRNSLSNSQKVAKINSSNYNRVKNLSSYSSVQKDAKLLSMINSQNSALSISNSLENLKIQKADIELKIKILKDKIENKNIKVDSGKYIYKIYPKVGEYINPGSKLIDAYDLSSAKLTIYIPADEVNDIKNKKIYLDDSESSYKIDKIWKVADNVNISSYKVEILINKPEQFSKLIKIEFK